MIGSRLIFVLDDLLWVLTDAQLVAALHFVQSLSGLVQKATELTQKQKAKHKLEVFNFRMLICCVHISFQKGKNGFIKRAFF